MARPFAILATITALVLSIGLARRVTARGRDASALGASASMATHGVALGTLAAIGRRIGASADRLGLPDWFWALAEKNRRKVSAHAALGLAFAAALFATSEVRAGWAVGLAGVGVAFQVGAFAAEWAAIVAQSRLLRDVEAWSGPARPVGDRR